MPTIHTFLFDDENLDKIAAHGLSPRQVLQILENEHVLFPNRKGRRALYVLLGRDNGGRCLAVPVEPTPEEGTFRPVTAWLCKESERALLERMVGR